MASPEELERELFGLLVDARTTNELAGESSNAIPHLVISFCFAVAALTIVALEHIANFPEEVINLIWKSRFSISSASYIWIRYFTLLALSIDISFMLRAEWSDHQAVSFTGDTDPTEIIKISPQLPIFLIRRDGYLHYNRYFSGSHSSLAVCILFCATRLLVTQRRVWILYGRSQKLLYFMVPLIAAEIIAMIAVGVYTIRALEQYVHVGPILGGCYSLQVPRLFTFYAVPPFVTAVLMFSITAFKCGTTLIALGPRRTPVIALFLRDGVFWFLALVLVSVVEIVLWDRARPTLAQIPVVPSTAFIAMISARVVLNIKHIASNTAMTAATTVETELMVRPPATSTTRVFEDYGVDTTKYGMTSQDA
ncbi:hypothetical protein B0H19DRAFT_1251358 [Mycena capillaripes]|nr:hypothetical protein B0H19DRAFT_1251358 [Mycena capillaripes]